MISRTGKQLLCLSLLVLATVLQGCAISGSSPFAGEGGEGSLRGSKSRQSELMFSAIRRADMAYQTGRWRDASVAYQKLLAQLPNDAFLWFRLGNSLTREGKYKQAIHAFEASLQNDVEQTKPWFNLSTAYLLGAQMATIQAWQALDANDPSRIELSSRLNTLTEILP